MAVPQQTRATPPGIRGTDHKTPVARIPWRPRGYLSEADLPHHPRSASDHRSNFAGNGRTAPCRVRCRSRFPLASNRFRKSRIFVALRSRRRRPSQIFRWSRPIHIELLRRFRCPHTPEDAEQTDGKQFPLVDLFAASNARNIHVARIRFPQLAYRRARSRRTDSPALSRTLHDGLRSQSCILHKPESLHDDGRHTSKRRKPIESPGLRWVLRPMIPEFQVGPRTSQARWRNRSRTL